MTAIRLLKLLALAMPLSLYAGGALAQSAPAQLVVAYVEAPATAVASVERGLRGYARGIAGGPGGPSVEILQEVGRPQRMAVIERWGQGAVAPDAVLAGELAARLQAPADRRIHRPNGPLLSSAAPGAFHMLMHVDVVPPGAALAAGLLEAQRADVLAAPGARGYELATQADRANHFAVHEVWTSRAAYEAYAASAPARELRRQLTTVKGALFDDRFFAALPPSRGTATFRRNRR